MDHRLRLSHQQSAFRQRILRFLRNTSIFSFASVVFLLGILSMTPNEARAQEEGPYTFTPAPDVWWNSVDGVRLGVRLRGEMEGTFKDGPHRLDAGVWLSTFFPDLPVSYYVSFTEPIPFISDFGEEGNIRLRSSVRTGFSKHGISLNKRWQVGFNEYRYKEVSVGLSTEKMFDEEYRQYPKPWYGTPYSAADGRDWIQLFNSSFLMYDEHKLGPYSLRLDFKKQLNEENEFSRFDIEFQQRVYLPGEFALSFRTFWGFASDRTPYPYSYLSSMQSMVYWMDQGISRAEGTIPSAIFDEGIIQYRGGMNLRGYLGRDIDLLNNDAFWKSVEWADDFFMTSVSGINLELDYPNPLEKALQDVPIIGEFMEARTYLFYDIGIGDRTEPIEENFWSSPFTYDEFDPISDFGTGFHFSFNIPDYLGKDRGIFIRYDIPFWLSDPGEGNPKFKYRSLIGIGAVISL